MSRSERCCRCGIRRAAGRVPVYASLPPHSRRETHDRVTGLPYLRFEEVNGLDFGVIRDEPCPAYVPFADPKARKRELNRYVRRHPEWRKLLEAARFAKAASEQAGELGLRGEEYQGLSLKVKLVRAARGEPYVDTLGKIHE